MLQSLTRDPVDVSNPGAPMLPCSFIPRSRNEMTAAPLQFRSLLQERDDWACYFTLLYYHFLLLLI